MGTIRILTDTTAQFTKPVFPGRQLIEMIPLSAEYLNGTSEKIVDLKVQQLPVVLPEGASPCLSVPSVEELRQIFFSIGENVRDIIAIFHSGGLTPLVSNAIKAAEIVYGHVNIQIIDSSTTSIGLGYLVQAAAQAAQNNASVGDIERLMRGLIPHIYTVFCIPNLTYLHYAGFLGKAQATVGEMLGMMPIFTLEEGILTPLEKVRNQRHLLDFLQEFIDEFSSLEQISIIQSNPGMTHEVKVLREHAAINFPNTPFSEHPISIPLAALFGPRTIGVYAIENPEA